jgi:hypothetical protein
MISKRTEEIDQDAEDIRDNLLGMAAGHLEAYK